MINLKGLDHVGIRVADFRRSLAFYRQFDFELVRADFIERVMVLRHASGLELNLLDSADRRYPVRNVLMDEAAKYTGYTHIALRVTDIDRTREHLRALGIHITEGPVTFGDGKTSVFVRDPDRNVIEFTRVPVTLCAPKERAGESMRETSS